MAICAARSEQVRTPAVLSDGARAGSRCRRCIRGALTAPPSFFPPFVATGAQKHTSCCLRLEQAASQGLSTRFCQMMPAHGCARDWLLPTTGNVPPPVHGIWPLAAMQHLFSLTVSANASHSFGMRVFLLCAAIAQLGRACALVLACDVVRHVADMCAHSHTLRSCVCRRGRFTRTTQSPGSRRSVILHDHQVRRSASSWSSSALLETHRTRKRCATSASATHTRACASLANNPILRTNARATQMHAHAHDLPRLPCRTTGALATSDVVHHACHAPRHIATHRRFTIIGGTE
jgi:hypothetical protein